MLILPGNPEFDETLASYLPPGWWQVADQYGANVAFVAQLGSGILQPVTPSQLAEYLEGGEYDERLTEIGDELEQFCE